MKIAIIQISEAGNEIASTLQRELKAKVIQRSEVGEEWQQQDAFIFIGAMGICVRTIAPFVNDKHEDPAVVCVDSMGLNAISVLSGHIGGANDLAREVAGIIGGREVITTQSDNAGLWALDTFEKRFDWTTTSDEKELQECIYAFVNRQPTALLLEIRDEGTDYLEKTKPAHVTIINDISEADPEKYELLIMVTPFVHAEPDDMWVLQFIPMVGTIGFGLAHHPKVFTDISTTRWLKHLSIMVSCLVHTGIAPSMRRRTNRFVGGSKKRMERRWNSIQQRSWRRWMCPIPVLLLRSM